MKRQELLNKLSIPMERGEVVALTLRPVRKLEDLRFRKIGTAVLPVSVTVVRTT
ncbi:hypothetical protein FHX75_1588 [Micromonospora palomenae]|uniref:Uncharacterized protein n=1 Tax=Micromonospora palomenae TaxID=1461247 RepID=A0A561VHA9_9ACTN|nr:hypothetical protein [Micromonospora palomenae]TWG11000.1 hypothetical protein FHX75_1588 [Micromonospora palomenae]